jgi:glycosyltransferase involved in cell wall biosynthesis
MKVLSKFNIARISTVPFFVVTQLSNQIKMIASEGANVSVVASHGRELDSLNDLSGVRCFPINIPRAISPLADFLALLRLIIFFNSERIQIAHSTTPKAGLLTAIAAFLARVPIRLHTFTGQPWVNMRGSKRLLARVSDKLIGMLNTRCYTDSASQRDFLINEKIVNSAKLFLIGSGSLAGVDVNRFDSFRFSDSDLFQTRESLGLPEDAFILIFIGRITADKGVCELLEAFKSVSLVCKNVHLLLVGPIDENSGVQGRNVLEDAEKIPSLHILGYTNSPEKYLSIADILCLPSYREGFGTVVIEAAAMGIPTIGSDIYGLSDAIVNGETGLLVPARDSRSLSEAILRLLEDKNLRKRLGSAARFRAKKEFSSEKVSKLLIAEYDSLLKEYCALE